MFFLYSLHISFTLSFIKRCRLYANKKMILALLCSDVYCLVMKDFPNKLSEDEKYSRSRNTFPLYFTGTSLLRTLWWRSMNSNSSTLEMHSGTGNRSRYFAHFLPRYASILHMVLPYPCWPICTILFISTIIKDCIRILGLFYSIELAAAWTSGKE